MPLEQEIAALTAAVQAQTAAIYTMINYKPAVAAPTPGQPVVTAGQVPSFTSPPLPAAPLGATIPGGPARPGAPAAGPAKPRGRPAASAAIPVPAQPAAAPPPIVFTPPPVATMTTGYESVAQAIQAVCEAKGMKVGVSILAQFNATHARQLTADKYPDVIAMCNQALAEQQSLMPGQGMLA